MWLLHDFLRSSSFFNPNLVYISYLSHSFSFYFHFFRLQGSSRGRWIGRVVQHPAVVLGWISLEDGRSPFSDAFSFPSDPWHHLKRIPHLFE